MFDSIHIKMKSTHVICALLGVTMSLFVLANSAELNPKQTLTAKTQTSTPNTTAEPKNITVTVFNSTSVTSSSIILASTIPASIISASTTPAATTSAPTILASTTFASTTPASTTPASTTPASTTPASTTPASTTPAPTKSTEKTITTSGTSPVTSTNASTLITTTTQSQTTATPVPSSSSKDRHFDGLSFFGGIILTTCLMAIALFSWKFYRQCNEGNYRTL